MPSWTPKVARWIAALAFAAACACAAEPVAQAYRPPSDERLTLSDDEREVLRQINAARRGRGLPALKSEATLALIARRHSEDMLANGFFSYESPTRGPLRYQLHRNGVSAAVSRFQVLQVGSPDRVLEQLRAVENPIHVEEGTHIGVGLARQTLPRTCYVTLIITHVRAVLDPFPVRAEVGSTHALSGRLGAWLESPRVTVLPPAGDVADVPAETEAEGRFRARVAFASGPGRYIVELTARGAQGPVVTDLMKVYVGVPYPPPEAEEEDEVFARLEDAEAEMVALLNAERRRHGLAPLEGDAGLTALARAHSEDMRKNGFFAHVSPTQGDLAQRVARARLPLELYAENLAIDTSLRRAHRLLMESPEHRRNVLNPAFTRIGVGIARAGGGHYCITQEFGRPREQRDPADVARGLLEEFNALRARAAQAPLARDPALDEIAQANSRAMKEAKALSLDTANALLRRRLRRGRATSLVLMSGAPPAVAQFQGPSQEQMAAFNRVGIGAVEDEEAAPGRPRWWTTVVLAGD